MTKLKTMKVLDVQWGIPKMPKDVKDFFFDQYDWPCNDVWVEYIVGNTSEDAYEYDEDENGNEIYKLIGDPSILDKWLLENTDVELGEEILLKH